MRLWHKDLIPVLPRQQLLSQWRECCCIARNIAVNGTPNHLLVNKILNYPPAEFTLYAGLVYEEIIKRGYKCDWDKFMKWRNPTTVELPKQLIFEGWHNERYLKQCVYNLQEKYDCGGLTSDEYYKIHNLVARRLRRPQDEE